MNLFAKRSKKRVWTALLLIMALLLSAVPMFAPASALEPPTSSTPLPTPSGVTSITIGGVTAGYWQDNNVPTKFIRAVLSPGSTEYDLKHATVVVNLVSAGTAVSSGTPGMTFSGSGTTTRTATNVDLVNKAYNVTIGSDSYILAAGLPDGPVGIAPLDPLGVYVDFNSRPSSFQTLHTDTPVDVQVSNGSSKIFVFTPSTSGKYKIATSPYGGGSGSSDTYLELYNDPNLTNRLTYNDDSNGTLYSEIVYDLTAGTTYYIKLSGTNGVAVSARLTASLIYDWYCVDVTDDNGQLVKQLYVSNKTNSSTQEARVINMSTNWVSSYAYVNNNWSPTGGFAYNGDLGGALGGGGTAAARQGDSVSPASLWTNIKNIDLDQIKNSLTNKALSLFGLSLNDFADQEDLDYFRAGISVGIDDNVLYGAYNKFIGLNKYEDEFYYLTGHQIMDEVFLATWAAMATDSASIAQASFAKAAAEGTGGLLLEATGVGAVGGVVLHADALRNVATGVISGAIAGVATKNTAHSAMLLSETTGKIDSLPAYAKGLNARLRAAYGDPPSYMTKPQAHHVFPQKFRNYFKNVFNDKYAIDKEKYAQWWNSPDHQSKAGEYNRKWEIFIENHPYPALDEVLQFGREIMEQYGFSVHF